MKERNVKISNDTDHDDNYRDNSNSAMMMMMITSGEQTLITNFLRSVK